MKITPNTPKNESVQWWDNPFESLVMYVVYHIGTCILLSSIAVHS